MGWILRFLLIVLALKLLYGFVRRLLLPNPRQHDPPGRERSREDAPSRDTLTDQPIEDADIERDA